MDVGEKSFLDQFLISYVIQAQKIPTIRPVNFVRVGQSFQLDVRLGLVVGPKIQAIEFEDDPKL